MNDNNVIAVPQIAAHPREAVDTKYGGFFWFFKPIICIEVFRGCMGSTCIIPFLPWREKHKLWAVGCGVRYHCPSGKWNECLSHLSAFMFCDLTNQ